MKITVLRIVLLFVFIFAFIFNTRAEVEDKVVLKTGEVFIGQIIVQTSEIVMIKTLNNLRFQFPVSSIRSIGKTDGKEFLVNTPDSIKVDDLTNNENLCGMLELSGDISSGKYSFSKSPGGEVSMVFGTRKLMGETLFAGVGAGYYVVSIPTKSEIISFIPIFLRFQSADLNKHTTAPYISLDAGYAFSTEQSYKGGTFAKFSVGVIHKITYKTSIYSGLYARVQGFSGELTEIVENKSVTYIGNSSIYGFGLKIGLQF